MVKSGGDKKRILYLEKVLDEAESLLARDRDDEFQQHLYYAFQDLCHRESFDLRSFGESLNEEFTDIKSMPETVQYEVFSLYLSCVEALIWSHHSPISAYLRQHRILSPVDLASETHEALRLLGAELDRLITERKSVKTPRLKAGSVGSPPAARKIASLSTETPLDWLMEEVLETSSSISQSMKQKRRQFKSIALSSSRWQETRLIREHKQQQETAKQTRALVKIITQGVSKFWKLAGSIAYSRHQHNMRVQLARIKMIRQREWVKRTQRYSSRLATRLRNLRPEMETETAAVSESLSSSEISSAGWSEQEEEDAQLEKAMSSDETGDEDEADILRRENEMTTAELLAKYKSAEETSLPSIETATAGAPGSSTRFRHHGKRRRSRKLKEALARKRRRLVERSEAGSASESEPDEKAPSPTETQRTDRPESANSETETPAPATEKVPVRTKSSPKRKLMEVSPLLRATLRPYQHSGFDWLTSLHECEINGILADEMGLGKTVQTIALLTWLATARGIWGPHLVIVPTSVVLNWEIEFRKFAPGLKILTYFGSKRERDKKRSGWSRSFAFHVCITSYSIALADASVLRRLPWYYMVLDEAQNLKNPESARWQTLLQFSSEHRLLLTGTPIQNNLMELWALMYFLMPEVFGTHKEWKELFSDPLTAAIERSQIHHEQSMIRHLYSLLRPFLCRRLKKDVEDQLPMKVEHVVRCHLTKRQKILYDELLFQTQKEAIFETGEYLAMMNILMQLRKICNHPNLLDNRVIETPIVDEHLRVHVSIPSILLLWNSDPDLQPPDLTGLSRRCHLLFGILNHAAYGSRKSQVRAIELSSDLPAFELTESQRQELYDQQFPELPSRIRDVPKCIYSVNDSNAKVRTFSLARQRLKRKSTADDALEEILATDSYFIAKSEKFFIDKNRVSLRTSVRRIWETTTIDTVSSDLWQLVKTWISQKSSSDMELMDSRALDKANLRESWFLCASSTNLYSVRNPNRLFDSHGHASILHLDWTDVFPHIRQVLCPKFQCIRVNKVIATGPATSITGANGEHILQRFWGAREKVRRKLLNEGTPYELYSWLLNSQIIFPDSRSIETDCGKLIVLNQILAEKKRQNLKCVVFTQMSRMLDILESFINLNGYSYVRLDGSTKPERRQLVVEIFNNDPRIFLFIASTRSGGVGINLVGGSTVIFYDTDWNPAMDRQAMDRCHRLGQTTDVHIYRLINENTIEENIWRKQLQKRQLDDIVVDQGKFTSELFFTQGDVKEILFTMDSSQDLYQTRVLHDKPAACDLVLKELAKQHALGGDEVELQLETATNENDLTEKRLAQEFAGILSKVEDAEDSVALKTNTAELMRDYQEFNREFDIPLETNKQSVPPDNEAFVDPLKGTNVAITPIIRYGVEFVQTVSITRAMELETELIRNKYKQEQAATSDEESASEEMGGDRNSSQDGK